jgi:hypothetical protein
MSIEAKSPLFSESGHQRSDLMSFQKAAISFERAPCR